MRLVLLQYNIVATTFLGPGFCSQRPSILKLWAMSSDWTRRWVKNVRAELTGRLTIQLFQYYRNQNIGNFVIYIENWQISKVLGINIMHYGWHNE